MAYTNDNNNLNNLIKVLQNASETMAALTKDIDISAVANSLMIGAKIIDEATRPLYQDKKQLQSLANELSEIYANIRLPEVDTEGVRNGFRKWGEYGWAVKTREIKFSFYKSCPATQAEADKMMTDFFSDSCVDDLFNLTMEQAHQVAENSVNDITDFEEAVGLFKENHFKACSLLMFSIIDGFFIRNEGVKRKDEKHLPVGLKAGKRVLEKIKNSRDQSKSFVTLCFIENLIACHEALFAFGDDFKIQPAIINRNFIDHGMYESDVNKLDCLRLFLYYYDVLVIFNEYRASNDCITIA